MKNSSSSSDIDFNIHYKAVLDKISNAPIPNDVKNELLGKERISSQKFLYLRLCSSFFKKYPGIEEEEKVLLSTSTFLSAIAVYAADHILDLQVKGMEIRPLYRLSHFCYLESQRLLAYLFSSDSPFWLSYYKRYEDHFEELALSSKNHKLDKKAYKRILECKYALMHVVIDMLDHLTLLNHKDQSYRLHQLLDEFAYGYNLPNEVKGLKTDLETGVNNYAYWCLLERCQENGKTLSKDPEYLHKLLYASGVAVELLLESQEVLEKVAFKASEMELNDFELIVKKRMENTHERLDFIDAYFSELQSQNSAT